MKKYALFLILPLLLVFCALYLSDARGPYWLAGNLDPDYVYLLNASNLADFQKVGHIDHPGTPVQMIGAITLRVLHLGRGTPDNLHTDVLKHPETYLKAINTVFIALNALMLLLLGVGAFAFTRQIPFSLMLQCTPFLPGTVLLGSLAHVRPEPLLLFTSLLFILFLVKISRSLQTLSSTPSFWASHWQPLLGGLVIGFGIATKVTFMPLAVIPLFLLPRLKNKLFYIGATMVGFVFFTLPIIGMYGKFFQWIFRLITRKGSYGTGTEEVISWPTTFKHIKLMLTANPLFTLLLALSILLILLTLIIPTLRKSSLSNPYFRLISGVTLANIIGLLVVSKHTAQHYLLPVLSLVGLLLVLHYGYLKDMGLSFKIKPAYLQIPFVVLIAALILWQNPLQQLTHTAKTWEKEKQNALAIYQKVTREYKEHVKIYYYASSSPAYALKFGNDLALNKHADVLLSLYPGVYFYDFASRGIFTFDYNQQIPLGRIQTQFGDKFLFQGLGGGLLQVPGLKLKPLPLPGHYSECIFMPDQSQVLIYDQMRQWLVTHVPPGATIVLPVEVALLAPPLQQDYCVLVQEMRKVSQPVFLNLAVCLDDPYFIIPATSFYNKKMLSPKFIQRFEEMRQFIQIETYLPNPENPQFFIGRMNRLRSDWEPLKKKMNYQELPLWNALETEPTKISPQLESLSVRGKFKLEFYKEGGRNGVAVQAVAPAKAPERTFNIFGYKADKKGLNLDIAKIDTVYLVVRVFITESMLNPDNHLFIQDFTTDWQREKVFFPATGWLTLYIAKKIRPQSDKLLLGLRFTPKDLTEQMKVKDIRVWVSNK